MENDLVQSEAKRLLLDRCLQGEFALGKAGLFQTGEVRPQNASHRHSKVSEQESAQQTEAGIDSSTNDWAKPQDSTNNMNKKNNRKSVARRAFNRFLHLLCRFGPGGATLRPIFHRMRGVKIGKNVWIGDDVYLDNEFPERIEVGDGAVIQLRSTIVAHTLGAGRVIIGKNAFIGAGAIVITSGNRTLVIGENSVIMAASLVTGSVAPYTMYGCDGSKPLARITKPITDRTTYEEFMTTLRPLSH
jgi:acetyltransferase-like isoleucine patch superfamily enzyme